VLALADDMDCAIRLFARVPRDMSEAAFSHYRELLFLSGLSSAQFAECINRDRGFLDDHECVIFTSRPRLNLACVCRYPFLQELVAQA
jgi:hypothetical protein